MSKLHNIIQKDLSIFNELSEETNALNSEKNSTMKKQLLKNNNNNLTPENKYNEMFSQGKYRGRKTFVFWTLVCLLLFLALSNLILTITILGILRLGYGMSSLELVPEASAIKFFGQTDLGHVYKVDGRINGFLEDPIDIHSDGQGSILLDLVKRGGRPVNKVTMDSRGMVFNNTALFTIYGDDNQQTFSTSNPHYHLLNGADKLIGKMANTNRIISLFNKTLELKADTSLNLKGSEGTRLESKEIIWSADQDIYLESVNGSVVLNGKNGVVINVKNIPIAQNDNGAAATATATANQFKICVCVPAGKLFRLPVLQGQTSRVNCNHIKMTPSLNPCM